MNRVLIVEDNVPMCQYYSRIFEQSGLDVTYVGTCQSALDYLENEVPALVVLDMGLPDECGQAVIDFMKSSPALRSVHLVVISANTDYKNQSLTAGVNQFIAKPVSPQFLLNMLQECGLPGLAM